MDSTNKRNVPPDGGWGYLVAISFTISLILVILSADTVGIVFGPYLQQIGHEARDVIQISSVIHMAMVFTGLPLNVLLQKMSCRKVAFLGSFFYLLGSLLTIFCTSTFQITVTYGVLEGCGLGLVLISSMTMFNRYFDKRRNFVNNCCHVTAGIVATTFPTFCTSCIRIYGFRGTIVIFTGIGMHLIVAAAFLQPVKWHMEKRPICEDEMTEIFHKEEGKVVEANNEIYDDILHTPSIRSRFRKLITVVYDTLDLGLFKVPSYVNIAFGVSLTAASDVLFISLLPWLLNHYHSDNSNKNLLITTFFTADLVGKVLLCIFTRFVNIRNRYLFLVNTYVVGIFRLAFVLSNSFWWIACVCTILGSVRCLVWNTLVLIFAEVYPKRFVTSYTLSTVLIGIVTLILGQIIGFVTTLTNNADLTLAILAVVPLTCAISWTIERMRTRNDNTHF